ncbi:oligosaccharide flippase family protein [Marinomonas sp.]
MLFNQKILKNLIALLGVQGVNYIFPLLSVAVVARALGIEHLGLLIIAQAISVYVQQATDFGFNLTATRKVALCHGESRELNIVFTSTIFAKLIVFTLATLVYLIACLFVESLRDSIELVSILLIGIFSSIFYPIWLFQGVEKMQNIFVGNFITKTSSLLLMLLFVNSPEDLYLAALIQSISWVLVALYSIFIIYKFDYCQFKRVNITAISATIKESSYIYFSVLANSFYTSFNIILLGVVSTPELAAAYGIADKLRLAAQSFIGVFAQALYPFFCSRVGYDSAAFWGSAALGLGSGLLFYFFAPFAVYVLSGSGYENAIPVVQVFSLLCPIIAISNYYSKLKIAARGEHRVFLTVYLFCAASHLSYVSFFINWGGIVGLSISVVVTELILALLMIAFSLKIHR